MKEYKNKLSPISTKERSPTELLNWYTETLLSQPIPKPPKTSPREIAENNHPLNRLAAEKLRQVGELPHPELLHCLQLAKWGLQSGKVLVFNVYLEDNLDLMLYEYDPKKVMTYLALDDNVHPPKGLNPVLLADFVLDWLDSRLHERLEKYANGMSHQPANVLA
jgi:hypothetical protein